MTAHVISGSKGKIKSVHISCDHMSCDLRPTDDEIIKGGGLMKLGWERRFDDSARKYRHYCPAHRRSAISTKE